MSMDRSTFDYHGFVTDTLGMTDVPDVIPDEDKDKIYGQAISRAYNEEYSRLKDQPLTKKQKQLQALRAVTSNISDARPFLGIGPEVTDKNEPFAPTKLKDFIEKKVDPSLRDAPLSAYLDDYTSSIINDVTPLERPFLEGLSKSDYKKLYLKRNNIDPNATIADFVDSVTTATEDGTAEDVTGHPTRKPHSEDDDSAWGYAIDQTQLLAGKAGKTIADFMNWDTGSKLADDFIARQQREIAEGNYESKYKKSFADTLDEDGVFDGMGWAAEKFAENWSSSGLALAGGAYAMMGLPLAAAVSGATAVGSSLLGIGEVRQELEDKKVWKKGDEATAIGAGILIGLIDKISGGRGEEAGILLKDVLSSKMPKMLGKAVLKGAAKEIPAEVAQEAVQVATAWRKGAEYKPSELWNRAIDTAVVSGTMGGAFGPIDLVGGKKASTESTGTTNTSKGTSGGSTKNETVKSTEQPFVNPETADVKVAETADGFAAVLGNHVGHGKTIDAAVKNLNENAVKASETISPAKIKSEGETAKVQTPLGKVKSTGKNAESILKAVVDIHNDKSNPLAIPYNAEITELPKGGYAVKSSDTTVTSSTLSGALSKTATETSKSSPVRLVKIKDEPVSDFSPIPLTKNQNFSTKKTAGHLIENGMFPLDAKGTLIASGKGEPGKVGLRHFTAYKDGFIYDVKIKASKGSPAKYATVEVKNLDGKKQSIPKSIATQALVDTDGKVVQSSIKLEQPTVGVRLDKATIAGKDGITNLAPDVIDDMTNTFGGEVVEATPKRAIIKRKGETFGFFVNKDGKLIATNGGTIQEVDGNFRVLDTSHPETLGFTTIVNKLVGTGYKVLDITPDEVNMERTTPDGEDQLISVSKNGDVFVVNSGGSNTLIKKISDLIKIIDESPTAVEENFDDVEKVVSVLSEESDNPTEFLDSEVSKPLSEIKHEQELKAFFEDQGLSDAIEIIDGKPAIVVEGKPTVVLEVEPTPENVDSIVEAVKVATREAEYGEVVDPEDAGVDLGENIFEGTEFDKTGVTESDIDPFLNVLPEPVRKLITTHFKYDTDTKKWLGNSLGTFRPFSQYGPRIDILATPNRTLKDVVETISHEVSHFSWDMWNVAGLEELYIQAYDLLEPQIKANLFHYYDIYGIDPDDPSVWGKSALVNEYFAPQGTSIIDFDPFKIPLPEGISFERLKEIKKKSEGVIQELTLDLTKNNLEDKEAVANFIETIIKAQTSQVIGKGLHMRFETPSDKVGSYTIRIKTTQFGTVTETTPNHENAKRLRKIKNSIQKYNKGWKRNLAKWMAANWLTRATFGVPTIGRHITTILARSYQNAGIEDAVQFNARYSTIRKVQAILEDNGVNPLDIQESYVEAFKNVGITDKKKLTMASHADDFLIAAHNAKYKNVGIIREGFRETFRILESWAKDSNVRPSQLFKWRREINDMASRIVTDWDHMRYHAYTKEGLSDLEYMRDKLYGSGTEMSEDVKEAKQELKEIDDNLEAGRITKQQAIRNRRNPERIIEIGKRMDALHEWVRIKYTEKIRTSQNAVALNQSKIDIMRQVIDKIIDKADSFSSTSASTRLEVIPAMKGVKLDPNSPIDQLFREFLSPIEDPLEVALFNLDQQTKVIAGLQFTTELGEAMLNDGIAWLKGERTVEGNSDLGILQKGTLLSFLEVDPFWAKVIKDDVQINTQVSTEVVNQAIGFGKSAMTIYNPIVMVNNYTSNASMLMLGGHLIRLSRFKDASRTTKKAWLDRVTFQLDKKEDFAQQIYDEMTEHYVIGSGTTSLQRIIFDNDVINKTVEFMTDTAQQYASMSSERKARVDDTTAVVIRKFKDTYGFGDEWVKPFVYLTHRAIEIARARTEIDRKKYGTQDEYDKAVMEMALPRAADRTNRETTVWENAPMFAKKLLGKNVRILFSDFLMQQLQFVKIHVENVKLLKEDVADLKKAEEGGYTELADELKASIRARAAGHLFTYGRWALLAKSGMMILPTIALTLAAAFDDDEPEDEKPIEDRKMIVGKDITALQQLLNVVKYNQNSYYSPIPWRDGWKFYAVNAMRQSADLAWAPIRQPTDDPEITKMLENVATELVNVDNDSIAIRLYNDLVKREDWKHDPISFQDGIEDALKTLIPGVVRLGHGLIFGDEKKSERGVDRWLTASELLGVRIKEYDIRDIAKVVGYNIVRAVNKKKNPVKRDFINRIKSGEHLSSPEIASLVKGMKETNKASFDQLNYAFRALRGAGMTDKQIRKYTIKSRDGVSSTGASSTVIDAVLAGRNGFDIHTLNALKTIKSRLTRYSSEGKLTTDQLKTAREMVGKAIIEYRKGL